MNKNSHNSHKFQFVYGKSQESITEYLNKNSKHIFHPIVDLTNKEFEKTLRDFYSSKEWKKIKNEFKKHMTQMCSVCCSEDRLVVDHIRPVRYYWNERLNDSNLQMLCSDCNREKGSILGWTVKWHEKNKESLSQSRILKEENIKYYYEKKALAKKLNETVTQIV